MHCPAFAWLGFKVDDAIAEQVSVGRGIADSGRAICRGAARRAPRATLGTPKYSLG
jgi:hypothetical protein